MKHKFSSFLTQKGRWLTAILFLLTFSIGNVWGTDVTFTPNQFVSAGTTDATSGITAKSSATPETGTQHMYTGSTAKTSYIKIGSSAGSDLSKDKGFIEISSTTATLTSITIYGATNKDSDVGTEAYVCWDGSATISATNHIGYGTWTCPHRTGTSTTPNSGAISLPTGTKIVRIYRGVTIKDDKNADVALGGSVTPCISSVKVEYSAGADVTAPTLSSSNPANSATDIAVEGNIVLTFSENVSILDASKFTLAGGAGSLTTASISASGTAVTIPYSGLANNTTYTLSTAAGAVEDAAHNANAALSDIAFTTVAAETPVCPSGMSISGTAAYTEGQTITLNAALSAGNGDITYTWYKGADLATAKAAGSIGTSTSFSKASCTTSDAGNYFCVATKDACSDAESTAYAVTVEEKTCPTSGVVYTMTMKSKSLSSVTQNTEVALVAGDYATENGGVSYLGNKNSDASKAQIKTEAGGIVYFNGNDAYLKVALECPLQPGDLITIEGNASSTELKYLITNTNSRSSYVTSTNTTGTKKYYTVVADDILDDESVVYIWREASGGNKNVHSVTITRPYAITFSSAKGSAPSATTGFEVALTQITGVDGWVHTGWTANKVVKVSGADVAIGTAMAVDATATVSDNTQFTAVWEEEVPTFSVTYKANNGTEEADVVHPTESAFAANMFTAPEDKMFNGWNTKAEGDGTPYAVGAVVPEATTVYAQWIVDPTIRLIKTNGSLNTVDFASVGGTLKDDKSYTVNSVVYDKYVLLSGTYTSAIAGNTMQTKYIIYDTQSDATDIKLYLYNTNSSAQNLYYQVFKDGAAVGTKQEVSIASKGDGQVVVIPTIEHSKKTRVVFCVQSTNILFCQIEVLENGTALAGFGENGYQLSIPGRPASTSKLTNIDGFEIKSYNDLKMGSGTDYLALRGVDGSTYVTFTTASNIQLQVTTANANKFYVCAANIGTSSDKQYGGEANTHNVNILAGTYYIVPTAGSSSGEVQITKLAFATAPDVVTVTFKDGESTLGTQVLFSGDKATALSPAPTKSGYRFVEWQLSGSAYDFDDAVTTNIELDAVWQKTWTVTFDSNGGSAVAAATVDDGQAVAKPADPTKDGFDFVEWQLNSATYNFASAVEANITLVATWEVAQDDASLSALSYNGNAIDVSSAEDVSGVQTYTVHLQWGSSIDPALVSVTKNAESATMSPITYNSEDKQATFQVTSGNGLVSVNYAIQFVIDAKRGTSIIKAVTANNTVTGLIGGTRNTNLSNGASKKLNTETYFGMTLAGDATFQEGDVIIINITAAADLGKFMVYADAERTQLVADQGIVYTKPTAAVPVLCPTGEMMMTLPAAANGKKSLYISREDGNTQWNVTFSSLEVVREMSPVIKSFKFGDDAATIDEEHKTISIEVPYATDVTALTPTIEAYGNNGATYTPSGATDFTSPVDYVVTDAYSEFSTTYAVTVTKAAASTNADLASLAVAGYSLDFDPATTSYSVVLDYGTTVLPMITYEVEETGLAEAVKVEGGVNGATTITVTPEAGAGYEKVYTINFSVSTNPKFVIYDGSTMTDFEDSGSDLSTGFAWTVTGGNHSAKNINITLNGKTYTKSQNIFGSATKGPNEGNTRYITITIPEGYLAKFYLAGATNSDESLRSSYISKEITGTLDESIAYVSTDQVSGAYMRSEFQLPGTYYYCADNSIRLYELSVQLYPIDYSRDVTAGHYGTICLPNGGVMIGATIFEVAYMTYENAQPYKVFFDEVLDGVMEAGKPYIFLPNNDVTSLAVTYTDEANASAGSYNGLHGTFVHMNGSEIYGKYIFYQNTIFMSENPQNWLDANRAYIVLSEVQGHAVAPLPGRRRVSMGVRAPQVATGIENAEATDAPRKMMINGELFILRGEKIYDATGRLVK